MNFNRYLIATLALFVFIFAYQMLVNGFVLSEMYEVTKGVWRTYIEMKGNMTLSICFQLATAIWLSFVFSQLYKVGGIENGLRFGLYIGVFAGIMMGSWYLWLP